MPQRGQVATSRRLTNSEAQAVSQAFLRRPSLQHGRMETRHLSRSSWTKAHLSTASLAVPVSWSFLRGAVARSASSEISHSPGCVGTRANRSEPPRQYLGQQKDQNEEETTKHGNMDIPRALKTKTNEQNTVPKSKRTPRKKALDSSRVLQLYETSVGSSSVVRFPHLMLQVSQNTKHQFRPTQLAVEQVPRNSAAGISCREIKDVSLYAGRQNESELHNELSEWLLFS